MIAFIFAVGWFVTACAFTWQAYKRSEAELCLWDLQDKLAEAINREGWVDFDTIRPKEGQQIICRNLAGRTWREQWDSQKLKGSELLGAMVEWKPE
jgi:hypothetical protein